MIMTSHIKFPKIDPDWPVTLSEIFIKNILRQELRYRGLIITDDLGMKAMTKHYGITEVPVRALKAGVDLLLYCNEPDAPPKALEAILEALSQGSLKAEGLQTSYQKILATKKEKITNAEAAPLEEVIKLVGHPDHLQMASAIAQGKMPDGLLPE
jgi:beta-N-acetylhexosaminidase